MIQRFAQFRLFRKGCGNSFSTTIFVWFSIKMFLMLYSISRPNFIFWLRLLLEILSNTYIVIACVPGCDVIIFENNKLLINLSNQAVFLPDQKVKIIKKLLRWNKKHFSSFFKRRSIAKKCIRPECVPLRQQKYVKFI